MITQIVTASGALVGGFIGMYLGNIGEKYLLGITTGAFLYLALTNMLPEILNSKKKATILDLILEVGVGLSGAWMIIILH